ncbi:OLC1v1026857C1 [Oldenlandia corymbosa var. corymbosa]|uniref:OLC1v1026857C1 n=1 Tax=Oldenlandia corymbosa var. corymbosa TaxID=529605 RepID=A0AAV1C816_OLDCO|nr:OLC1v1026857C1 [Oldenlandia corymbosa var. corymbosa]
MATKIVKSTLVWAKLPGWLVPYYNNSFLRRIGSALGRVARVDQQKATRIRGRFTRLAVEIELDQPMVSQIDIKGRIQKVEHENMPPLCASCNRVGHQAGNCPYVTPQVPREATPPESGSRSAGNPPPVARNNRQKENGKTQEEWVLVLPRNRPKHHTESSHVGGVSNGPFWPGIEIRYITEVYKRKMSLTQ